MCYGPHAGFPRRATLAAPKGEWPYTEETPSGAAPTSTSPPKWVFRHKRLRELVELSGRTTGPNQIHMADYSLRRRMDGNAGTTILYHPRIYRRQHSSSVMTAGRRELLEDGHRRRFRRGRRTFRGTTGRTEQRAD